MARSPPAIGHRGGGRRDKSVPGHCPGHPNARTIDMDSCPDAAEHANPGHRPGERRSWSAWGRVRQAVRLTEVRLRVPIVLVVAAVVVGRWDVIRNYWDRLTHRTPVESLAGRAVSSDTEYFCPMDPGVR